MRVFIKGTLYLLGCFLSRPEKIPSSSCSSLSSDSLTIMKSSLKPLLSISSSCSICRVGEQGGDMSFLKKSDMVFPSDSRCGSLATTRESRRLFVLLKAIMGGFGKIVFNFGSSPICGQCFKIACLRLFPLI